MTFHRLLPVIREPSSEEVVDDSKMTAFFSSEGGRKCAMNTNLKEESSKQLHKAASFYDGITYKNRALHYNISLVCSL